jgi:hypothetical protein
MHFLTWKVANGTKLTGPLAFGMFASIEPGNASYSTLIARVLPGFPDITTNSFPEVCSNSAELNAHWTDAIICRKVVPIASAVESGAGVFESEIRPIDGIHGIRTTIKSFVVFTNPTFATEAVNNIPAKFLAANPIKETRITAVGTAAETTLASGQLYNAQSQITPKTFETTIRFQNVTTETTLTGSVNYVEGFKATVLETFSYSALTADAGLYIFESEVEHNGNHYIRRTVKPIADAWPELTGSNLDPAINKQVKYTRQFVAPPTDPTTDPNTTYTPINVDRSLKETTVVPTAALAAIHEQFPIRVNPKLPKVLKGIQVVWNSTNQEGTQDSAWSAVATGDRTNIACNLSDVASSEGSALPEFIPDIDEWIFDDLPGVGHVFYLASPVTEAAILAKLGATRWPVFRPKPHTLVGKGIRASCSINVGVSSSASVSPGNVSKDAGKTESSTKGIGLTNVVLNIQPTIHGVINLSGDLTKSVVAEATAFITCTGSTIIPVTATKTDDITLTAEVYPTSLPATPGPTAVPITGIYLLNVAINPFKWGYYQVFAETFDASVLADPAPPP